MYLWLLYTVYIYTQHNTYIQIYIYHIYICTYVYTYGVWECTWIYDRHYDIWGRLIVRPLWTGYNGTTKWGGSQSKLLRLEFYGFHCIYGMITLDVRDVVLVSCFSNFLRRRIQSHHCVFRRVDSQTRWMHDESHAKTDLIPVTRSPVISWVSAHKTSDCHQPYLVKLKLFQPTSLTLIPTRSCMSVHFAGHQPNRQMTNTSLRLE